MAYTSKLNSIIARIVADVASVTGISASQVHNGRRNLYDPATWQALGMDATYMRPTGWYVDRVDGEGDEVGLSSSTSHLRLESHTIEIVGWLGVSDPQTGTGATTATVWRQRCEDVRTAIREDLFMPAPLGGTAIGGEPPLVQDDSHEEINGVLCHYIRMTMTATERIAWS